MWGKGEDRKGASGTPEAGEGRSSPWDGEDASVLLLRLMKRRLTPARASRPPSSFPRKRESRGFRLKWIPAFAGMTGFPGSSLPFAPEAGEKYG